MWEEWPEGLRSHQHAFMGTVDDWLHQNVAGIEPAAPASGAVAHAATVAAAGGTYAPDTASEAYFAAWSAATAHPADRHYLAQNAHLLELIAGTSKTRLIDATQG
jgi:hypothetical protein